MAVRRDGTVALWLGLAMILGATTGSPFQRNRRILNEPGDIPTEGNVTLPYDKRQQIIYLLSKDDQSKRDKEPGRTVAMEKYAKELSSDGKVVMPNAGKLLVSEDFHRGSYKEMAVNKGDGPPGLINAGRKSGRKDGEQQYHHQQQHQQQQQQQQQQQEQQQQWSNTAVKKSDSVEVKESSTEPTIKNRNTNQPQVNSKRTETYSLDLQSHQPYKDMNSKLDKKFNDESSSALRKKDSFIKPIGRLFDGEILPPSKPIEPDVFEIGEDEIENSGRRILNREDLRPPSGVNREMFLQEDRPARRLRHRHRYFYHRRPPMLLDHQPSMYYMPLSSGRSNVQMLQFAGQGNIDSAAPPEEYSRQPVMMQPVVPMMSSEAAPQGVPILPSQPVLQNPYVQQLGDRSSFYTVPMATAPQQPQPQPPPLSPQPQQQQFVYPVLTVPALQQTIPQVQLVQQPIEQDTRLEPLARHWIDEPGRTRSEVNKEYDPKPREYDDADRGYDNDGRDSRYDEDRYHDYAEDERMNDRESERMNDRRYHDDRDSIRDEEEREAEHERFFRERGYYENSDPGYPDTRYPGYSDTGYPVTRDDDNADENARVRSSLSHAATASEETNDDDDEEEDESEENERALQDSRDEPPNSDEGPPEEEKDEASPNMNYRRPDMESREQPSVFRIPPFSSPRQMPLPFAYPKRFSMDTYSREQLLGPSVPLREKILPRFMYSPRRMTPIESPSGEISEMSASEARFRERMRLELQAKDTIPKGFHSHLNNDGFKNVVIRLNGEPLENASELRSRIIDGRIIQGKGKVIKSKGPMRIRVTHKGKGRNRIKFIDIISPEKYSVTDSRSKIGRVPSPMGTYHKPKSSRNQIHRKSASNSVRVTSLTQLTVQNHTVLN